MIRNFYECPKCNACWQEDKIPETDLGCCPECCAVSEPVFVDDEPAEQVRAYGGSLKENLIQSSGAAEEMRRTRAHLIERVEAAGGRVVAEIDDEIVLEVHEGFTL